MSAEPRPAPVPQSEPSIAGLSPKPFPGAPPAFVIRAAIALRRFLLDLADAVVPADVAVFEAATGAAATQLLGAVARHRVADLLQGGPLTAAEIAAKTGTKADVMHRTLRALASKGIFTLDRDGRFANNRRSRTLLADRLTRTRDFAEYFASRSNCEAWTDYETILRTGTNGFERVHGMSVWDWFDAHPEEREGFAQAMMGMTFRDAPVVASVYPFAESRRVCDVGGGRGTLLSEILIRHPHLQGVLCDAAGVLDSAKPLLERRGVAARVELVAANFFESVPRGADAHDEDHPPRLGRRAREEDPRRLSPRHGTGTQAAHRRVPARNEQDRLRCARRHPDDGRLRRRT